MDYRQIGDTDLVVSVAGLGCNNFGTRLGSTETAAVVHAALEAGCNLFDTARSYGNGQSESYLGAALGSRRADVIVATKFGREFRTDPESGASRAYVLRVVEDSLRALQTDYIDLYQLHQPDPTTPIEETLDALNGLVERGVVRYIGCSNFDGGQLELASEAARTRGQSGFVTVQNEWSLLKLDIEENVTATCQRLGLGVLPYYPLASGLLTGKMRRGMSPPEGSRLAESLYRDLFSDGNFAAMEAVTDWGRERGRSLLEVSLGYLAGHEEVVSVIAGATKPDQVRQNAAALLAQPFSRDECAEVAQLVRASLMDEKRGASDQ